MGLWLKAFDPHRPAGLLLPAADPRERVEGARKRYDKRCRYAEEEDAEAEVASQEDFPSPVNT